VLTIRPTKMLAKKLGISIPTAPPPVPSRVADWCAHSFRRGNERWLIFCNTASLYAVVAGARGVTDGESLARRIGGMVPAVLRENGFAAQVTRFEDSLTDFQFAPVPDRSVLGSITDLIYLANGHLDANDITPAALAQHLGRTPMSALGMNNPARALATLHG
jgi:hypothetical protein